MALVKGSGSALRALSRSTLASSSKQIIAVRRYATEADVQPVAQADLPSIYATSSKNKDESGSVLKRYTGKGFPMIPGLRHLVHVHHPHLHAGGPVRELTVARRKKGGRNDTGQVVNRSVGGGHRQRIRIVDFHRLESGEHHVVRIEYDPGRSAHIALLKKVSGAKDVTEEEGAELAELEMDKDAESALTGQSAESRYRARVEVKGGWSYILAPEGLRAGDKVVSYRSGIPDDLVEGWEEVVAMVDAARSSTTDAVTDPSAPQTVKPPVDLTSAESSISRALGLMRSRTVKPGNVLPLYLIPPGTVIHNISMTAGSRMQLCRAAGSSAQVVAHHGGQGGALGGAEVLLMGGVVKKDAATHAVTKKNGTVLIKLQSDEVRRFEPGAVATIGSVSNREHHSRQLGKAGRSRWLGIRPHVRGVAMNACDHPHGGGRGKSKGNKHPRSIYGWLTKGKRTRRPKDRDGNKMVVTERPRGKERRRS